MGGSGFGGMGSMSSGFGGMGGGMSGMSGGFGGMGGGGMGGMGSGMGGSGFGGMGNSGFGTSGFGTGGMGGGQGMNRIGGAGNAQGGQAFVGRDSGDMSQVWQQLGRNSNRFFQQMNRNMGGGNRNRRQQNQQATQFAVPVKLVFAADQAPVRPQPSALAATVRGRLESTLADRNMSVPGVEVDGDTVILAGVAASESQRMVIERLVSLEPGVSAIDNQMTVADSLPIPPVPPQDRR